MINRRRFLQSVLAAAAAPSGRFASAQKAPDDGFGRLAADPGRILDLPPGFRYQVISRLGDEMDDGLLVPGDPDGMAAFPGRDGTVVLVCNHENLPGQRHLSPFGPDLERLDRIDAGRLYDAGRQRTPGTGGTTTIVYDPVAGRVLRRHLSLAGTELNCAGGPTPWGSWLSCEESFGSPGIGFERFRSVYREQRHGYVFEVPSRSREPVPPQPLREMGRFEHEAAVADPSTGIVYLTEDRHRSLFYRFLPREPGRLARGGRLQALALADYPSFDTRNWHGPKRLRPQRWVETRWIDLEDVDSDRNDLRFRGHDAGAARFARGEGLCVAGRDIVFTCTVGGPDRLGQVFRYRPGRAEGTAAEKNEPGRLQLFVEATDASLLQHADNVTATPWGDLLVCEDTAQHCGLVGVRPDGRQYPLADNAYSAAELAGITFSPDGRVMFVNVQQEGLTLAITGPWPTA